MGYLLSQIWLCLLIAALIGGIIGWLLRGGCRNKIETLEANYRTRLADLEHERDTSSARAADFEAVTKERDELSSRLSDLQAVKQERDALNAKLTALESSSAAADEAEPTEAITTEARSSIDKQASYDIEEIEGIGAGYGKRLRRIGIDMTTDLLDQCPDSTALQNVAGQVNMEPEVVRSWVSMADLMRVEGIGGQYAELLEFSGVHTVNDLAGSDADGLTLKMNDVNAREHRVKEVPEISTVKNWIEYAETLTPRLSEDIINLTAVDKIASDTMSIPDADLQAASDIESSYDIEEIEGIGKGYGKKLRELGIATTADMLNKCPDEASMQPIIEAMNLEDWVIRSWVSMADLVRVNGVGGQYAELLNFSEIRNVEALAKANPAGLVAKLTRVNQKEHRVKEVPDIETVTGWIEHAKTLPEMLRLG